MEKPETWAQTVARGGSEAGKGVLGGETFPALV